MLDRRAKAWGLVAIVSALLSVNCYGLLVFVYPVSLSQALSQKPVRVKLILSLGWGLSFAAAFYYWVGAYGLLPWLALAFVRGLPWVFFSVPELILSWRLKEAKCYRPGQLSDIEILGGALGTGLVSWLLLAGITGVDWETPAGGLVGLPQLLWMLPYVHLSGVAFLIGLFSHLLGSGRKIPAMLGGFGMVLWVGLSFCFFKPAAKLPSTKVALIQTGLGQDVKWDPKYRAEAAEALLEDTARAAETGANLVVWPETAWPYRGLRKRVSHTRRLGKLARSLKVDILVSSIEDYSSEGIASWENSVSFIRSSGAFEGQYSKRRLAPFAEYIPFAQSISSFLRGYPPFSKISHFVAGKDITIFETSSGQRFGVLICYESMVPEPASILAPGVDFLVVITNDAPFASSKADEAHFRSAILRAIESRKPIFQASNTGVTGIVTADGIVVLRTSPGFHKRTVQYLTP